MYIPIISGCNKYGNNRWLTYSLKIKRNVWLYSDLEYDNWVLVETNPLILSFCEQPLRVRVNIGGTYIETIFDMWILRRDKTEAFIEVKYSKNISDVNFSNQINAQRKWCKDNGVDYLLITESDIRNNPIYLTNMKRIIHFAKQRSLNKFEELSILRQIQSVGKIKIINLLEALPNISESSILGIISKLYLDEIIQIDCYSLKLSYNTEVFINEQTHN